MELDDYNGNGYYDIKDFIEAPNEEILKFNEGMKFDVILANPPFDGATGLHLKFLIKCNDLCNGEICFVQPATWIFNHTSGGFLKSLYTNARNLINTYKCSIEKIDGSKFFDAGINSEMAISCIDNKIKENKISLYYNGKLIQEVTSQNDILNFSNNSYVMEFKKHLDEYNKGKQTIWDITKAPVTNQTFILNKKIDKHPNLESWCICVQREGGKHGSISKDGVKDNSFYQYIPKDRKPIKFKDGLLTSQYFVVNSYDEGMNAIHYLKSDFARMICYISREMYGAKFGYDILPLIDFTRIYTEDELFNMIGMTYDIDEVSKVLPDTYNQRK